MLKKCAICGEKITQQDSQSYLAEKNYAICHFKCVYNKDEEDIGKKPENSPQRQIKRQNNK